jgi:hypothetical protein
MSSSAPGWSFGRVFGLHGSGSEGSKDEEEEEEEEEEDDAMASSGGDLSLSLILGFLRQQALAEHVVAIFFCLFFLSLL